MSAHNIYDEIFFLWFFGIVMFAASVSFIAYVLGDCTQRIIAAIKESEKEGK